MLGELIPIIAISFVGLIVLARTQVGAAIAHRIAMRGGEDGELADRVAQLEHDLGGVREQLSEAHERLDFTERMLAQVREAQKLPPAQPGHTRIT